VLPEVATDLAAGPVAVAYGLDAVVGRLAESLTGRRPQVLLVGPRGSASRPPCAELVRRRYQFGLGETRSGPRRLATGRRMSGYGCAGALRDSSASGALPASSTWARSSS